MLYFHIDIDYICMYMYTNILEMFKFINIYAYSTGINYEHVKTCITIHPIAYLFTESIYIIQLYVLCEPKQSLKRI